MIETPPNSVYMKLFLLQNDIHFYKLYSEDTGAGVARGIVLGYGLDDRGFRSRQRLGIFLFTTAVSRSALGLTKPPT
jgi:hypothetical protein